MAVIEANIFSKALMRTITVTVVVPGDKTNKEGKILPQEPYKTLYLLNGVYGNHLDFALYTKICQEAQEKNLAIVMINGENRFYVDDPVRGENYGQFVGEEILTLTRNIFNLSNKRSDTFIAGISMGGYGAIRNGLKYHNNFSYIAGLSSALITDRILSSSDNAALTIHKRSYFESIFGDINNLPNTDMDCKFLLKKLIAEKVDLPNLYMCCGKDDFLYKANIDFVDFLNKQNIKFTWESGSGNHNWIFWDTYLKKVLAWLPLENNSQGINSGNVVQNNKETS